MKKIVCFCGILLLISCATEVPISPPQEEVQDEDPFFDPLLHDFSTSSLFLELSEFAALLSQLIASNVAPEDVEEYVDLFFVLANLSTGDFDAARSQLDARLEEDPTHIDALYLRALVAEWDEDFDAAVAYLRTILEIEEQARFYAALGEVLTQQEKYEEARSAFERSLVLEENYVALRGLGNMLIRTTKYMEAENTFDKAIALNPEDSFLYSDRGTARIFQSALKPAVADFTRAIELNPDFAWNYLDRGRVYMELRQFQSAHDDYDAFLARESDVFIAYIYRAQASGMLDDSVSAAADYQKALELRPDYYPAYASYALTQYLLGRYRNAAEWFEKGYSSEGYYEYLLLAAISHIWTGQDETARKLLEKEIRKIPLGDPFRRIAGLYAGRENLDRVRSAVKKLEPEVDKVKATVYLAIYYDQQQKFEEASFLYRDAMRLNEQSLLELRIARYHLLTHDTRR